MAATLVSIAVTPATPTLINGQTVQLTATGTYDDASTADLTSTATWASATPAHVTVGAHGLATGVATGTSVVGATVGEIEGHTTVTSGTGYLTALAITPVAPVVLQGQTQALVATGTYQDASTADVTTSVTWASSVTAVGTVGAHTGTFTAVAGGPTADTTVSCTLSGITASAVVHVSPLVADFFAETDVQNFSSWTQVVFGFGANSMALANVSGVEVQFSLDGVNKHGILDAASDSSGHAAAIERDYGDGARASVWLRRTTGTGGGTKTVRVSAARRYA